MNFKPTVLKADTNQEFRWKGHLFVKGLFDGEHFFKLEETAEGHTRFIHGENFSGILSGMVLKKVGKATRAGFAAMNEALKNQVEQLESVVL